jgi:hypothetical protein
MKTPPAPTSLEKVAGGLPAQTAATIIAALAGGALAPMLPVLSTALASERQKERVEKYLHEVSRTLERHEATLRVVTDAQYKLINEAILASLQTTQVEKLGLLRNAVRQSLDLNDVEPQEAILLARILRDISAEEAMFVVRNFSYDGILIAPAPVGEKNILCVPPESRDALIVGGLLSLGVITPGQPTLGQILYFSGIVAKLIVLLSGPEDA